jgi:hypothetical protein
MSACIASTEPPDGTRSGGRIDGIGSSAQTLNCIPESPCGPDDPPTEPDPPPQPRCPVKWFCNGGLEHYDSWASCNAECSGTCGTDYLCDSTCYCP